MACGDRYRYLVVTASGLNLENPYDNVPLFSDFEEWKALARRLLLLSQEFKDVLAAQEEAATPGQFPLWNAVNEVHARAVEKYDALPSLFSGDVASDVGDAQSAIFDALCVIEMSEDAIVELGGTAPPVPGAPPPKQPPSIIPEIPPWVLPVGLGVAALWLYTKVRRR